MESFWWVFVAWVAWTVGALALRRGIERHAWDFVRRPAPHVALTVLGILSWPLWLPLVPFARAWRALRVKG